MRVVSEIDQSKDIRIMVARVEKTEFFKKG